MELMMKSLALKNSLQRLVNGWVGEVLQRLASRRGVRAWPRPALEGSRKEGTSEGH